MIILDSSTSVKFSNHVIIHIPNCMFKDNIHMGSFVRYDVLDFWRLTTRCREFVSNLEVCKVYANNAIVRLMR